MSSGSSSHGAALGHSNSGEAQLHAASPAAQPLPQYVGRRRRLLPGDPLFEYADLERQLGLQDAVVQVSARSLNDLQLGSDMLCPSFDSALLPDAIPPVGWWLRAAMLQVLIDFASAQPCCTLLAVQGVMIKARCCEAQVSAAEEEALLRELRGAVGRVANRGAAAEAPLCSVCGAALPTAHLLSLHISEAHDSFFAAQAARKLKVPISAPARQEVCSC